MLEKNKKYLENLFHPFCRLPFPNEMFALCFHLERICLLSIKHLQKHQSISLPSSFCEEIFILFFFCQQTKNDFLCTLKVSASECVQFHMNFSFRQNRGKNFVYKLAHDINRITSLKCFSWGSASVQGF